MNIQSLIKFAITFIIVSFILTILGYIVALIIIGFIILINRILAYIKKHKRFTDWEFDNKGVRLTHDSEHRVKRDRVFTYKRYDRKLDTWEYRYNVVSLDVVPTSDRSVEDILDYYGSNMIKLKNRTSFSKKTY